MTVWLFDCLTVWLFDCLTVWLFDCLTVWLFDCLIVSRQQLPSSPPPKNGRLVKKKLLFNQTTYLSMQLLLITPVHLTDKILDYDGRVKTIEIRLDCRWLQRCFLIWNYYVGCIWAPLLVLTQSKEKVFWLNLVFLQ